MALSSDEIIKREIIDVVGPRVGPYYARVFSEGSNDDQRLFIDGGLTFSHAGQDYGSCDCVYVERSKEGHENAVLAIEGTDCLGRGSSGNAQYQRFHHVLGAVKNKILGVYYLREGRFKVQPDLYGMAFNISKAFGTPYLIIQDLNVIKKILELMNKSVEELNSYVNEYQQSCYLIYKKKFEQEYDDNWEVFANARSTIIFEDHVVKYASRNRRNFTDSQLRGGHIAVGEMFLTKYSFIDKKFFYLWPRMTEKELFALDISKSNDKEWLLLRNEPGVTIKTLDDIMGLPKDLYNFFYDTRELPLLGSLKREWNLRSRQLNNLIYSRVVEVK
jgi:hypothetical protein